MSNNYSYPLDPSWSTEEISSVLSFLNQVEDAYETKADVEKFLASYKAFKTVVPSKMEEKRIDREFEKASGYSTYRALQAAKTQGKGWLKLGR